MVICEWPEGSAFASISGTNILTGRNVTLSAMNLSKLNTFVYFTIWRFTIYYLSIEFIWKSPDVGFCSYRARLYRLITTQGHALGYVLLVLTGHFLLLFLRHALGAGGTERNMTAWLVPRAFLRSVGAQAAKPEVPGACAFSPFFGCHLWRRRAFLCGLTIYVGQEFLITHGKKEVCSE